MLLLDPNAKKFANVFRAGEIVVIPAPQRVEQLHRFKDFVGAQTKRPQRLAIRVFLQKNSLN